MADHGDRPTADELIGDALRALNSFMTARIRPDFVDLSVAANRQKLIAEPWPPYQRGNDHGMPTHYWRPPQTLEEIPYPQAAEQLMKLIKDLEDAARSICGVPAKTLGEIFAPVVSQAQQKAPAILKVLTDHTVALAKDAGCRVEEAEPATHAKPFPAKAMR